MCEKNNVRADLHVHIDGRINEENIIKTLKKAQNDGCKKLCILEHCHLNILDDLLSLLKKGEVEKYFKGSLIIGCEYDTLIDAHFVNEDGSNYDNYISHILVYMSLEDAIAINKNVILHKRNYEQDYIQDYEQIIAKINGLQFAKDLQLPTIDELKKQETDHIGKDLHAWIVKDENRKAKYMKALSTDETIIDYPAPFVRNIMQKPSSPLFYKPASVPFSSELFKIIRKKVKSATIVLAHPAYMHTNFNTQFYLDTMMSYQQNLNIKTFDGIEPRYYLNTKAEQDYLIDFAKKHNFIMTAGSDSVKIDGLMYFNRDGKKLFFRPTLGNALGTSYDIGNVDVCEENGQQIVVVKNGGSPLEVDKDLFEDIKVDCKKYIKEKNKELFV